MRTVRSVSACAVLVVAVAMVSGCGGSSSSPSGPSGGANSSPVVTAMIVTPSYGVSGLTIFSGAASATDTNNDPLTYTWTFGSAALTGANVSGVISGDGAVAVRLTVTDGRGGTATDTKTLTIGTMTGTWNVAPISGSCPTTAYVMTLTQTGGTITGTALFPGTWCHVPAGTSGTTDPAEPGIITAAGAVTIRVKAGRFSDFYMRGTMDSSGRVVTGGIFNSGWNGESFRMTKG